MNMKSGVLAITTGLVEVDEGNLIISSIQVKDITLENNNLIKVNNGAGDVEIADSSFENIKLSEVNNGGTIFASIASGKKLDISGTIFKYCNVTQPSNGGALFIIQEDDTCIIKINDV
jgi:hypothetical protein